MMKSIHIRKTISLLMTAIFACYYVNANFFWHDHAYYGYVIHHSHIHLQSHHNSADGGHDDNQLQIISDLAQTAYNNDVQVFTPAIVNIAAIIFAELEVSAAIGVQPYRFNLRAPPAFLETV